MYDEVYCLKGLDSVQPGSNMLHLVFYNRFLQKDIHLWSPFNYAFSIAHIHGLALNYSSIFHLYRRKMLVLKWENLKDRDPLEPRHGWESNIEIDRTALGWDGTD